MTKTERESLKEEIESVKVDANRAKDWLMTLREKLEALAEPKALREAERLEAIIGRLEYWQNT